MKRVPERGGERSAVSAPRGASCGLHRNGSRSESGPMKLPVQWGVAGLVCVSISGLPGFANDSNEIANTAVASEGVMGHLKDERMPSIQPRQIGDRWLYRSYLADGRDGLEPSGITVEEVVGFIELGEETCYQIRLTVDERSVLGRILGAPLGDWALSWFWEFDNAEGSWNWFAESGDDVPQSLDSFDLTLRFPVEAGDRYEIEDTVYRVISTNKMVSVPAGDFECVVYEMEYVSEIAGEGDAPATRERYYQHPGTGLVRWEMDQQVNGVWVPDARDELVEVRRGGQGSPRDNEPLSVPESSN